MTMLIAKLKLGGNVFRLLKVLPDGRIRPILKLEMA